MTLVRLYSWVNNRLFVIMMIIIKLIINNRTLNQYVNPMYRVCNLYKETIDNNTVAALNLSKVWVHNYIDTIRRPLTSTGIICKEYNIKVADKWYEHTPETVIENEHETWTIQLSSGTLQLIAISKSNPTGQTSLPCPWYKTKCWRSALATMERPSLFCGKMTVNWW